MDIVVFDNDGSELGIISAEDFVSITTIDRIEQKDSIVRVKVKYSDKNWLLVRDMYFFCDNEVREVLVGIVQFKIDDEHIALLGTIRDEALISVVK